MIDPFELGSEFFERLRAIDQMIIERAAEERCPNCHGSLCRSDYPRKPRWGSWAEAASALERRFSLCCSREGCRRRATPPSVRFLGRRVYAGAVVVLASALAVMATRGMTGMVSVVTPKPAVVAPDAGVPGRTIRRWLGWWQGPFTSTASFLQLLSRLVPPPEYRALPASLLERLGSGAREQVGRLLAWIAPETTASCPDGSRLMRGVM
jgi:hypothetical protein